MGGWGWEGGWEGGWVGVGVRSRRAKRPSERAGGGRDREPVGEAAQSRGEEEGLPRMQGSRSERGGEGEGGERPMQREGFKEEEEG